MPSTSKRRCPSFSTQDRNEGREGKEKEQSREPDRKSNENRKRKRKYPRAHQKPRPLFSLDLLRKLLDRDVLGDGVDVDAAHGGVVPVDDLGELLEGGTAGLDVHGVDEDELDENPALLPNQYLLSTLGALFL